MLIALVAATLVAAQDTSLAARTGQLMPVPRSVTWGAGRLRIDSTFSVAIDGWRDARLERAIGRALLRLRTRSSQSLASAVGTGNSGTLVVRVAGAGQPVQGVTEDESYALEVTPAGASLAAPTVVGAIRGLETFLQLVSADGAAWSAAAARVEDAPRFPWRGLLVDASRHFMPPEVIRRTLDGMAAVKLNVLHWHLSDDQGFRVESRRFPRLQQFGSDGLFYSPDDIRGIVAYARDRGIRVVPEFDMPGHTQSWLVGYPQYSAGDGPYEIERRFGVFDPVFDPTNEAAYTFLDGFIGEMAALFPDAYWHIGGDEVNGVQWNANARIAAFKQARGFANNEALHTYFNQRLLRILARHHKQMIGWDEILQPGLPTSTVIQSWRGTEYLSQAAQRGYGSILSAPFYLDHQSSAEYHYSADPLPATTTLTPAQQALVLGGEACMWAEHVTPETVDSRIWPRMAAVAERLWSPREVRDVGDMYRRLRLTSVRLEELGLTHEGHTDRMLRRIASPDAARTVRPLLALTQTASFGQRGQLQRPNQMTPLSFLVDAAVPDPASRWQSVVLAEQVARDAGMIPFASATVGSWRSAGQMALLFERGGPASPQLAMVRPAALAMDTVATIAMEALRYIEGGQAAPAEWATASRATLRSLAEPRGLLRLTPVEATRVLVRIAARDTIR